MLTLRELEGNRIGELGCNGRILREMHLTGKCESLDRVCCFRISYSAGVLQTWQRIAVCIKGGLFPDK